MDQSTVVWIIVLIGVFTLPRLVRYVRMRNTLARLSPVARSAVALLDPLSRQRPVFTTLRSRAEYEGRVCRDGKVYPVALTRVGEFSNGDVRIAATGQGDPAHIGEAVDHVEMIVGRTRYTCTNGEWTTKSERRGPRTSGGNAANPAALIQKLCRASIVEQLGSRRIEGIECDVFRYVLPPQKVDTSIDLYALRHYTDPKVMLVCDRYEGEYAVGVEDHIVHQDVQRMAAHAKSDPSQSYELTHIYTVWDHDNPDIVVEAPAELAVS